MLGVVYPEFCPLQNRDAVEMFDALLTAGKSSQQSGNPPAQRLYHTGGYLGNGEVVWVLAKLPKTITIVGKDDVVESYMLLTNSHDGTFAISFRLTTVRVVCQNTLVLPCEEQVLPRLQARAQDRPSEARRRSQGVLSVLHKIRCGHRADFPENARRAVRTGQIGDLVATLLPLPRPPSNASISSAMQRQYDTRLQKITEAHKGITTVFAEGCNNGLKIPPSEKTLWGALNSITAFVDHKQEIKGDRYAHILFGRGATLKQKAYDLALAQLPK